MSMISAKIAFVMIDADSVRCSLPLDVFVDLAHNNSPAYRAGIFLPLHAKCCLPKRKKYQ